MAKRRWGLLNLSPKTAGEAGNERTWEGPTQPLQAPQLRSPSTFQPQPHHELTAAASQCQQRPNCPVIHRIVRQINLLFETTGLGGLVIHHHRLTPQLMPRRSTLPGQHVPGWTSELLGTVYCYRPSLPPLFKQDYLLQLPCSHFAMFVCLGGAFSSHNSLNQEKPDLRSCSLGPCHGHLWLRQAENTDFKVDAVPQGKGTNEEECILQV